MSDPERVAMVMEPRSMDGLHGLDIKKTGEYEICLDNSFSSFTGNGSIDDVLLYKHVAIYMHSIIRKAPCYVC